MKILIPFEIPEDCDFISVYMEAFSDDTSRISDREYEAIDIDQFRAYYQFFKEAVIDKGLI